MEPRHEPINKIKLDQTISPSQIKRVDARLRAIYGEPRRRNGDPVSQLVGTILSQATTDVQSGRAYDALRARFPTWEQVRDAPLAQIETLIRPAGLSRQKAPRIQAALQYITRARGKITLNFLKKMSVAAARQWLMDIHGVGPKTASIILLFSLGLPAFPVDTHIWRIAKRLGWISEKDSAEKAHQILGENIPAENYYRVHVNLIRFGREICIARMPRCEICPLTDLCVYYQQSRVGHTRQKSGL